MSPGPREKQVRKGLLGRLESKVRVVQPEHKVLPARTERLERRAIMA